MKARVIQVGEVDVGVYVNPEGYVNWGSPNGIRMTWWCGVWGRFVTKDFVNWNTAWGSVVRRLKNAGLMWRRVWWEVVDVWPSEHGWIRRCVVRCEVGRIGGGRVEG